MSRSSLRAKPIEVTLGDSSGPQPVWLSSLSRMLLSSAKRKNVPAASFERVGMEDLAKFATFPATKALSRAVVLCPWRSGSADKALARHRLVRAPDGEELSSGSPRDGDMKIFVPCTLFLPPVTTESKTREPD